MIYFLMLIFFAIGAYWQSIKNKPLAIIVILSVFFGYVFLNKKENHQRDHYYHTQKNKVEDTSSSKHYGYDNQCTAICYDGTCSKSLGRRGVCSSHGGVKHWLR
jgi:hypothetical protein